MEELLTTEGSFAARAEEVVGRYAAPIEELDEETLSEKITWLLADLMHLTERDDLDWNDIKHQAEELFWEFRDS